MSKRFHFIRTEDVSGVSGTGLVAEGIEFSSGEVVLQWVVLGKPKSLVIYHSIMDAIAIHGHEGRTTLQWVD